MQNTDSTTITFKKGDRVALGDISTAIQGTIVNVILDHTYIVRWDSERIGVCSAEDLTPLLTRSSADRLAKELNNAIGFWTDDENAVYGVLRQLKAKTQLSYLSDVFFQNYKMDLYQLLQRNLNDKEIDVVNSIAANLS